MQVGMMWWVGGVLVALSVLMKVVLKRANSWLYESKLGEEKKRNLPPGDLGLPFMGNMWSFLKAFKSSNPDSFLSSFISRSLSLTRTRTHARICMKAETYIIQLGMHILT